MASKIDTPMVLLFIIEAPCKLIMKPKNLVLMRKNSTLKDKRSEKNTVASHPARILKTFCLSLIVSVSSSETEIEAKDNLSKANIGDISAESTSGQTSFSFQ